MSPTSDILDQQCLCTIDLLVECDKTSAAFWTTPLLDVCAHSSSLPHRACEAALYTHSQESFVQSIELPIKSNEKSSNHFMVDYVRGTTLTNLWLADSFIISVPTIPCDQGFRLLTIVEPSLLLLYQAICLLLTGCTACPWF
jgi:hypothetical protein